MMRRGLLIKSASAKPKATAKARAGQQSLPPDTSTTCPSSAEWLVDNMPLWARFDAVNIQRTQDSLAWLFKDDDVNDAWGAMFRSVPPAVREIWREQLLSKYEFAMQKEQVMANHLGTTLDSEFGRKWSQEALHWKYYCKWHGMTHRCARPWNAGADKQVCNGNDMLALWCEFGDGATGCQFLHRYNKEMASSGADGLTFVQKGETGAELLKEFINGLEGTRWTTTNTDGLTLAIDTMEAGDSASVVRAVIGGEQ